MKKCYGILFLFLLLAGCTAKSSENGGGEAADSVYIDTYYTEYFHLSGDEFTGGDGCYSVQLPDGRTAWLFGDTFMGGVNPDNTRSKQEPRFIRNSVVIEDGKKDAQTLYTLNENVKASFVIPPLEATGGVELSEDSLWYWPGDGMVEGGMFKLFLSEFSQLDTGMWDFHWQGTWIASYELPDFRLHAIESLPWIAATGIHFGHAVCETKEYTYIYGAGLGKPYVARYAAGDIQNPWEYFTGESWSSEPSEAVPMADIQGSEQFSVFELEGSYVLLTQMGGFSDEICTFTSDTPYGPWSNQVLVYKTPLPRERNMNIFSYNALAHPEKISRGELLVSYNMNSMVLEDHYRDAGIYHPRFIRVPVKLIVGDKDVKR